MGFFDKDSDPIKEVQKTADAAGKGIASAAEHEQAADAAQYAANQTGPAAGDLANKTTGTVQNIGDAIIESPKPKSFKYSNDFSMGKILMHWFNPQGQLQSI